ncbi:MAG: hypothetical protein IKC81_04575 [Paludibacteraceae bacterium]|nr:hypothetical protein [Paludibacteraceae bacterium]
MIRYTHTTSYFLFCLTTIVMLGLFVCGFLLPPIGVIDNSVIQAGGELMGLAFIAQLPLVIRLIGDRAIRIKKGDFSIEASDNDEK